MVATARTGSPALIIALTLPLIPVFMVLVGLATRARTRPAVAAAARLLGGHFLDVVEGLPTLKVFGRAKAQAEPPSARSPTRYRRATMGTLRIAFLSSLVLELVATLSVALVAVSIGLRLLGGELDLRTALVVLVLAPEAYLPLRQVGRAVPRQRRGAGRGRGGLRRAGQPAGATALPDRRPGPRASTAGSRR